MARRLGVTSPLQVRWLYLRVALVSCYPEANFGPSDKRQTENTVLFGQTVISGLAAGSMVAIEKKSRRCVAAANMLVIFGVCNRVELAMYVTQQALQSALFAFLPPIPHIEVQT